MNRRITQLTILFALLMAITLPTLISPTTASAQATTTTTNFSIPVNQLVFVPCANGGAGETVMLSGYRHIVTHFTSNENHVTIRSHLNAQGVSGTGLTTGDTYQATRMNQSTSTFQNGAEPFIHTFLNSSMFIGQGPGNNFRLHHTDHFTFNGNGELTSMHTNFFTDCK